ncbi:MAG: hypothetical protein ACYC3I_22735 [Gemmataceae bacterium]
MLRLVGAGLAAAVLHAVVLAGYVAAYHGDLAALVCVARERLGRAPYELIHTGFDRNGYDGQFYYAIARAPWHRHDLGIDAPAIRQARILYPALSWLLSGGDARRLFWAMPLVNLLAIAALATLGAAAARGGGLNPWWGVLLPFAVNAGMPALRNLTDVLSTLSVAALLIAWLRRWPWWIVVLYAAAALFSREQNVVVVLLVLFSANWQAGLRQPLIAGLLAALLLWSLWLGVLRIFYGEWPLLPAGGNLAPPLTGMIYRWTHLAECSRSVALFHVLCLATLILQLGLALWLVGTPSDRLLRLTALAGAGLALLGGVSLYGDNWSYPRVFAWLPLAVWLACVQLRRRWPLVLLSAPAVLPLAILIHVWTGAAS